MDSCGDRASLEFGGDVPRPCGDGGSFCAPSAEQESAGKAQALVSHALLRATPGLPVGLIVHRDLALTPNQEWNLSRCPCVWRKNVLLNSDVYPV